VKQIAVFVLLNSNPDNIRFTKSSSSMMNNQLRNIFVYRHLVVNI
jgi:hypothetical protein